jgi:hypothetical protein
MDNPHDDDLVKKMLQDKILELEEIIKIYKKSYEINIEKIKEWHYHAYL